MVSRLGPHNRPILVYALSGLGKSALCRRFPHRTADTDTNLDAVLAPEFPDLTPPSRRVAWRALARSEPWCRRQSVDFQRWARVRRALIREIVAVLTSSEPRLVLTNMTLVPWPYAAYYGVQLGGYMAHWSQINRDRNNSQEEAWNNRLEGYYPLVRVEPGTFLGEREEIIAWLTQVG